MHAARQKILITGGAGYIGSHAVVALHEQGYEPVVVDSFVNSHDYVEKAVQDIVQEKVRFYRVDCTDEQALRTVFEQEGNISGVMHFAAFKAVGTSVNQPLAYYENNINALITLLKVMQAFEVGRLVFSSSCTVYGEPASLPVTENFPVVRPSSPYGNTKRVSEEIIEDTIHAAEGLSAISLRYFNPIGAHASARIGELPLGKPNNLVPFITQTAAGWRDKLVVHGNDYKTRDGTCIRDYIHVVDLIDAHIQAMEYMEKHDINYDVFNIGTGNGNTVLEVVQAFERVSGVSLAYETGPRRPGDVEAVYAGVNKSRDQLGWQAQRGIEDALKDAWQWQLFLNEQSFVAELNA